MIQDRDIDLIRTASHGDPFSVLGVHADDRGWLWLRAFLPSWKPFPARAMDLRERMPSTPNSVRSLSSTVI